MEFYILECFEEVEDRESFLFILCLIFYLKLILKKIILWKIYVCIIIVYGEWGFVLLILGWNKFFMWCVLMGLMVLYWYYNFFFFWGFISKCKEFEYGKIKCNIYMILLCNIFILFCMCKRKCLDNLVLIELVMYVFESNCMMM